MSNHRLVGRLGLGAICAALLAPMLAMTQPAADRDSREVNAFVLTEAVFAKYAQATKKLQAGAYGSAANCDHGDGDQSIDAQVAHLNAIPGAAAAVKSAGLSAREYVVISWSLLQAGIASWALAQPGAKPTRDISMANVNFYRAHEAAIKSLGAESRSDDCRDDDDR
jgi:hypothetical protein